MVIASFFGMNVPVPGKEWPYSILLIVGLSVLMSLAVIWYFRRTRLF
ncbi:MAG: CorA family divalent cation transporter [Bacteroidota bacterium]